MKKRIVSLLLALVMVLSLVPTTVWAAEDHDGQVRVIVENTTYAKADGAAWDGTLVDKWVDLVPGSSMMDCIVSALGSYSQTGAESGYISEINGLSAGDGGAASGWMGTLNDWFTNVGFNDIKAGDKLFAGDTIRVMYTTNGYGADIGGDWNTQSDTSLAALSFSEGVLTPDFASDKTAYTLTLPQGVTGIRMTATASNKNNQVYLSADGTDYRRVETVPVHNGTVLTIRCGDKAEATEWSPAITPTTYTVTVSQEGDAPQGDLDVSFKGLHSAQLASLKLYDFADGVKGDRDLLANVTPEADGYKLMMNTKLPAGDYLVEGYNAEGQCNGSLVLTVKANQDNVFTLNRAYEIYATNDSYSWVEGTDYSIDVTVTAADGTDLQAKTGVSTTYGSTRTSCLATMTANRPGTAIVQVTYDAMTFAQGMGGKDFSAIWPEFTGVFVVSVGADGSSIETNTFIDRPTVNITKDEQKYLDAEHDILFYVGTQGASYSFTPQEGCTVTVARSTVTDKMSFNGFTSQGVSVDENGQVTVTGLTTGRHILRIEKDGMAAYQVITARGVSYDLIDADGNVLPQDAELVPGQAVKVQFHDLVSPKEKISGVYNFNFSLVYLDAQGNKYQTNPGTPFGQYDFSGNPVRQLLSVTIPETAEGYSYDLTGTIRVGGFGGIPTHRGVSYRSGMDRQYGSTTAAVLTRLPELVLPLTGWYVHDVEQKIAAIGTVTLDSEEAIQAARAAYDALSDQRKAQVSNYDVLLAAEKQLAQLQDEAVAHVEKLIDAIGQPVIPASRAAVEAARAAYDALGQKLQARVGNYDVLLAAEARLAELNAQDIYKTTGDFIVSKGAPVTGSIGGEWAVLGLARSGRDVPGADAYYASVVEYVQKAMDENGRLNRSRSTENSRLILALTAIGKDVTHVAGRSLLDGLDSMAFITKQSVNGPVWALLALDSHGYPTSGDVTREKLVRAILDTQREDGSWPVIASSQVSDVDMTAMAIQALAPYYENAQVKAAVDAALTFLAGVQNADGTFSEIPGTDASAESTAQVIVALTALGIDPTADSRFVKSGVSVVDALCGFYVTGGGFRHLMADKTVDGMATEQGYYALAAYYRLTAGKTSLYDMSDVTITVTPDQPAKPDAPRTGDESPVLVWMGMAALAGAAVLLMQNKKKRA